MNLSTNIKNFIKNLESIYDGLTMHQFLYYDLADIQDTRFTGFKASSLDSSSGPMTINDFATTTKVSKMFEDPNSFISRPQRKAVKAVKSEFYEDWIGDLAYVREFIANQEIKPELVITPTDRT